MTVTDHDTCVLNVVRRAVVGLSLKHNWGLNRCTFDEKVFQSARSHVDEMTSQEYARLQAGAADYRLSLDAIKQEVQLRGEPDERIAYLILAMYFNRLTDQIKSNPSTRKIQEAS